MVEQGSTRDVLTRPRSPFTARIAGLNLVPGRRCPEGLCTADGLVVSGLAPDVVEGEPAVAVFPPSAVAVFREEPHGSPRNVFPVRLAAIEPRGDVVRLRAVARDGGPPAVNGLAADVTPAAVADLDLTLGSTAWAAVKATEIHTYPA